MRFIAARSRLDDSEAAAEELLKPARDLAGSVDLAALFLTAHHRVAAGHIAQRVRDTLAPGVLIGCTCESVIGVDEEIEGAAGISLLVAHLPGVTLRSFHIAVDQWDGLLANPDELAGRVGARSDTRAYLVLADPFTTPADEMFAAFHVLGDDAPILGGMASGAQRPGGNALLLGNEIFAEGLVGVSVSGDVQVETVVSQGCRPIGSRLLVTSAEANVVHTLGGRPALAAAQETIASLSEADRALLDNGLFLGVVRNEYQAEFGRGDFLIRNVIGAEPQSGAIAIGDHVRAGQTVQFHVRDAGTADEDLRDLLRAVPAAGAQADAVAGGLIFSCNGRGSRMFPLPGHDVQTVLAALPGTPLAGFFAMGEIGPIGGRSYLHGHTASIALFRPLDTAPP